MRAGDLLSCLDCSKIPHPGKGDGSASSISSVPTGPHCFSNTKAFYQIQLSNSRACCEKVCSLLPALVMDIVWDIGSEGNFWRTIVPLLWVDMYIGLPALVFFQGMSGLDPCEYRSVHYIVNNIGGFFSVALLGE